MPYQDPALVKSPRNNLSDLEVIYDGGEEMWEEDDDLKGWSLASMKWCGNPSMGIRWNGNTERPAGIPQSRGIPTWFILPGPVEKILQPDLEKSMAELKALHEKIYG